MQDIEWTGEVITKPGMYKNIPLPEYHKQICDGHSVSSSGLRTIIRGSPADFYDNWSGNPYCALRENKRHFIFGSAAHHLFLGQKGFGSIYITEPVEYEAADGTMKPWHNGANDCKKWHEEARRNKLTPLKPTDAEQIIGMSRVFHRHPMLNPTNKDKGGIMHGLPERSYFWQDQKTGIWIKTRPDVTPTSSVDFVDYKTTTSTQMAHLLWEIANYGYDMQADLILTGARKIHKLENPKFTLVFQQKTRPYHVRILHPIDEMLARGAQLNRYALDTMAGCLKSGIWPGPGGYREDAEPIDLSDAEKKRAEAILQYGI